MVLELIWKVHTEEENTVTCPPIPIYYPTHIYIWIWGWVSQGMTWGHKRYMDRHFEETWTYSLLETWIKLFWCNFISQTHSLRPTGTHTYTIASDRNLQMVPRYLQVSSYRVFRNTHRTFPIAKYSKSKAAADNDLNWGSLGFGGMARVWSLFSWTCIICKDIHPQPHPEEDRYYIRRRTGSATPEDGSKWNSSSWCNKSPSKINYYRDKRVACVSRSLWKRTADKHYYRNMNTYPEFFLPVPSIAVLKKCSHAWALHSAELSCSSLEYLKMQLNTSCYCSKI